MEPKPATPPSPHGFRILVLCGFVLAGVLTAFLTISLRAGDTLRAILHAALLWVTITLIERNLDNLAAATGRPGDGETPPTRRRPDARS